MLHPGSRTGCSRSLSFSFQCCKTTQPPLPWIHSQLRKDSDHGLTLNLDSPKQCFCCWLFIAETSNEVSPWKKKVTRLVPLEGKCSMCQVHIHFSYWLYLSHSIHILVCSTLDHVFVFLVFVFLAFHFSNLLIVCLPLIAKTVPSLNHGRSIYYIRSPCSLKILFL